MLEFKSYNNNSYKFLDVTKKKITGKPHVIFNHLIFDMFNFIKYYF